MPRIGLSSLTALAIVICAPGGALAGGLFEGDAASLIKTERFSAEITTGLLTGQATEIVNNVPSDNAGQRLSELDWRINRAFILGGRVAVKPFDWLSIRGRGWAHLSSMNTMEDFDWTDPTSSGAFGFTQYSHSSDTNLAQAWQGDVSGAVRFYQDDTISLTAIGGYRHMTMKFQAKGGAFLYSSNPTPAGSPGGFYDISGMFPPGQVVGTYQQWWDTPYLGLGLAFAMGDFSVTSEFIGSLWSFSRSHDHHVLRSLLIDDQLTPTSMFGVNLGGEYRFNDWLSFTARGEYQQYSRTHGTSKYTDTTTGTSTSFPDPQAGAAAENFTFTLGVKARL